MKKILTLLAITMLTFVGVVTLFASDSKKVSVEMAAALPGAQYASNIIPNVAVGKKLNLKYTITFKEETSAASIFNNVKRFFGSKDDSYIGCYVNFAGVQDVTLVKKTNGVKSMNESVTEHFVMQTLLNQGAMKTFRIALAEAKGLDMIAWGNSLSFSRIDKFDEEISKYGSIDKADYGMKYSITLTDFVDATTIAETIGEENTNLSVDGKNYIILFPYKKDGTYEIEFQLDTQNVTASTLSVKMDFFYYKDYNSRSTISAHNNSEDNTEYFDESSYSSKVESFLITMGILDNMEYLDEASYYHMINIK